MATDSVGGPRSQVLVFSGLERRPVEEAEAGDIVLISGIEELGIGMTMLRSRRRSR